jgi:hypothetical protein
MKKGKKANSTNLILQEKPSSEAPLGNEVDFGRTGMGVREIDAARFNESHCHGYVVANDCRKIGPGCCHSFSASTLCDTKLFKKNK